MKENLFSNSFVVSGICFIAASILMLALRPALDITEALIPSAGSFVVVGAIFLYGASLMLHVAEYASLGRKHDSPLLIHSSWLTALGFGLLCLAVIASAIAYEWFSEAEANMADALIGLSITLLTIPALLLAIALIRMYDRLGIGALTASGIVPAAVIFMWQPWPAIAVVGITLYLLLNAFRT